MSDNAKRWFMVLGFVIATLLIVYFALDDPGRLTVVDFFMSVLSLGWKTTRAVFFVFSVLLLMFGVGFITYQLASSLDKSTSFFRLPVKIQLVMFFCTALIFGVVQMHMTMWLSTLTLEMQKFFLDILGFGYGGHNVHWETYPMEWMAYGFLFSLAVLVIYSGVYMPNKHKKKES